MHAWVSQSAPSLYQRNKTKGRAVARILEKGLSDHQYYSSTSKYRPGRTKAPYWGGGGGGGGGGELHDCSLTSAKAASKSMTVNMPFKT